MPVLSRGFRALCLSIAIVLLIITFGPHISLPNTILGTLHGHDAYPKNAYCAFLAEPNDMIKPGQEDVYFIGIRMLAYQLLHDPETKTNSSIPFVVMVQKEVPESKRDRLRRDGAIVVEVNEIKISWIKPGSIRWARVMDKLRVFELTQYDKILLLDSDIVVTRRLDAIFDEVDVMLNRGDIAQVKDDESPQPTKYLMAGNCGPSSDKHGYPAERCRRLNAGFVLLKPSIEMFDFYMSLANNKGRFPGGSPEQDLWNYAHRLNGNMPWKSVHPNWTVNSPNFGDYEHDVATLHEKYWRALRDKKLRDVLLKSRWKMEGFFNSLDLELAQR